MIGILLINLDFSARMNELRVVNVVANVPEFHLYCIVELCSFGPSYLCFIEIIYRTEC